MSGNPSPHPRQPEAVLPQADRERLQRIDGCEQVDLLLPDMNGLLRGKRVARSELEKAYASGICLPMSLLGTDITGNTVEETGLGYEIGDEDRTCRPIPGSLRAIPWQPRPTAQVLLSMEDAPGQAFDANPREVLRRVLQGFDALGLKPVLAVEMEFYLLDPERGADGRPRVAINPATGRRPADTQVYSMQDLDDFKGFTDAVAEACRAQDIPADTAVAEYAPGQFEINLRHRDDALLACDEALMLKRAIKAIAARQGMLASFMAKPFAGQAGSGMHVHASVLDRQGDNIFAGAPGQAGDALRHAIAGLQASADDCLLLFAPHANSYRRFVANAFVPLDPSWGFNNRTVAMRIPHSDAANTRIEHRVAGADGNPYLVVAAVLAGMLRGLRELREPGPPTTGNAYLQAPARVPSWREAIGAFQASVFVRESLGARFQHLYGQVKAREWRDFQAQVTDLDYDWYLRQA